MTYLLDTNIISYIVAENQTVLEKLSAIIENYDIVKIPVVAYYEIRRGLYKVASESKRIRFQNLLEKLGIEEMTTETFTIAAQIYEDLAKEGKVIEDDDIFIGATALESNAILVTNNEKHLGHINGLKIEMWN